MINFQQVADSTKVIELTKKLETLTKQIDELEKGQSFWNNLISTLDVIIWPLALITFIYLFKSQIRGLMDRFKSLKISQSGIEAEVESLIDETSMHIGMANSDTLLIDEGSIIPKDGSSIIPKDGSSIIPKDGSSITPKDSEIKAPIKSYAESPYQELLELKEVINQKLKGIAGQNGINISTSSNFTLVSILKENGKISGDTSHKLKKIIELNNIGLNSPKITHEQVSKIKRIYNNISF